MYTECVALVLYMDVLKKEWFDSGCSLPKKELLQKYIDEFQDIFKENK